MRVVFKQNTIINLVAVLSGYKQNREEEVGRQCKCSLRWNSNRKEIPKQDRKGRNSGQGVKLRNSNRRVEREEMGEQGYILRLTESYWAPPKILLLGILRLSGRKRSSEATTSSVEGR